MLKKMLFVMNPYAGMRKANRYLADIIEVFNRADYEVITYMTAGPGDAAKAVRDRIQQVELVVCAGGDGTFNETITGVLSSGVDVPIGYIPCGSTNDFAASLKLSTNVVQAAKDIAEGLFVSSRTVSGAMRKLVTDGYVEKVGQEPVVYAITEKGKNIEIN